MYGCSDASIVYGFNIGDRGFVINQLWMKKFYPEISLYAMDITRNYLGEAIYGISCGLDINTGAVSIDPQSITKVKELYDKYMTYLKNTKDKKTFNRYKKEIKIGYRLGLYGYDKVYQQDINIDPNWNSEDEEDEEEDDEEDEEDEEKLNFIGLPKIFLGSTEIEPGK
jgi:hypothetical protein